MIRVNDTIELGFQYQSNVRGRHQANHCEFFFYFSFFFCDAGGGQGTSARSAVIGIAQLPPKAPAHAKISLAGPQTPPVSGALFFCFFSLEPRPKFLLQTRDLCAGESQRGGPQLPSRFHPRAARPKPQHNQRPLDGENEKPSKKNSVNIP